MDQSTQRVLLGHGKKSKQLISERQRLVEEIEQQYEEGGHTYALIAGGLDEHGTGMLMVGNQRLWYHDRNVIQRYPVELVTHASLEWIGSRSILQVSVQGIGELVYVVGWPTGLRMIAREHPEEVVHFHWVLVGRASDAREEIAEQEALEAAYPAEPERVEQRTIAQEVEHLADLKNRGLLTDEEFAEAKRRALLG